MAEFDEWTAVTTDSVIPAGSFDLKLNDIRGEYFTEIRMAIPQSMNSSELDQLMTKNVGLTVFVQAAKSVPFPENTPTITLDEKDYEFLMNLALDRVSGMNRASRILNSKLLFRIVANARRSH